MTDASSPFDDPEFVEMLKRSGVTHRPGMAAELMEEIGPLLAADGFDPGNPNQEMDLDDLNSSMSQAIERRNMELVTPVGEARALTVNLLREFVMAYTAGNSQLVDTIFGQLRPDPTKRHPSFSHVMGVALETLDEWYTAKTLRPALRRVPSADMPAEVKPTIADVEALARKGRAFRSIDRLLLKQNGAIVTAAGAYLVAATLAAVAKHRQQSVGPVLDELLPGDEISVGFGSGAAFGAAAAQQVSSQDHLGQFNEWLIANEDITISAPEDIEVFETIVDSAPLWGLDPFDPDDFADLVDMVLQLEDSAAVAWSLAVLHDYVHFRMEGDDPQLWEEPHELINDVAEDEGSLPPALQDLMTGLLDIPVEDRYAVVTSTPLVSGVARLVEWIGKSKPATGTGMPKRADIETVAAMIGIDAQGVAKLPPPQVTDADMSDLDLSKPAQQKPTLKVQSAKEISVLRAWWTALEIQAGIELTSTKVQPGPMSEPLAAPQIDDLESVEMFIVSFIQQYLVQEADALFGVFAIEQTIAQLVTLAEANDELTETDSSSSDAELGSIFSSRHLRNFESMGLLEIRDAKPFIPESLRHVVMLGCAFAVSDLELGQ